MKQTAVEWLFERFIDLNADMKYSVIAWEEYLSKRADLFEQAKEMEKEQFDTLRDFDKWKEWLNKNIYDKDEFKVKDLKNTK